MGILIVSCSHMEQMHTALDVINSDDYWEPIHADVFDDGGSVALGLKNGNGEVVYLWADTTALLAAGEPQTLVIKLNYNDPDKVPIPPRSELEDQMISILDNLHIRPEQEIYTPLVEDFRAVLIDRTNHVYEEIYKMNN